MLQGSRDGFATPSQDRENPFSTNTVWETILRTGKKTYHLARDASARGRGRALTKDIVGKDLRALFRALGKDSSKS